MFCASLIGGEKLMIHIKQSISIYFFMLLVGVPIYFLSRRKVRELKMSDRQKTGLEINIINRHNGVVLTLWIMGILAILDQLGLLSAKK